jgi:hypothetical protein
VLTNDDSRRIARDAFLTKYLPPQTPADFNCSNGFIQDFKSQIWISSRRSHDKRRGMIDSKNEDAWIGELRDFTANASNLERVINCDETCRRDHVAISIAGDEKHSFAALCCILAARRKLRMVMIVKRKTMQVEKRPLGEIEPHLPCMLSLVGLQF